MISSSSASTPVPVIYRLDYDPEDMIPPIRYALTNGRIRGMRDVHTSSTEEERGVTDGILLYSFDLFYDSIIGEYRDIMTYIKMFYNSEQYAVYSELWDPSDRTFTRCIIRQLSYFYALPMEEKINLYAMSTDVASESYQMGVELRSPNPSRELLAYVSHINYLIMRAPRLVSKQNMLAMRGDDIDHYENMAIGDIVTRKEFVFLTFSPSIAAVYGSYITLIDIPDYCPFLYIPVKQDDAVQLVLPTNSTFRLVSKKDNTRLLQWVSTKEPEEYPEHLVKQYIKSLGRSLPVISTLSFAL